MALVALSEIRAGIDRELTAFVESRTNQLRNIDSHLTPVAAALSEYVLSGGKRFRPTFAYLGYLASGGDAKIEALRACSSLELVHACALIHDDVMDGSDSRRNQPAIHKRFETLHLDSNYSGSAPRFGVSAAILLGDLALSWSDWMLSSSGIDLASLNRSVETFQEMREELMAGQYLDVLEGAISQSNRERSLKIANLKSGKYSIERPLHFGAALAGASADHFEIFTRYGLPLGQAFQLRDDLLGVFGDSKVTGKPSGDDIREGKRTVLVAIAIESATEIQKSQIEKALGDPNLSPVEIEQIQETIEKTGARSACEALIDSLLQDALTAIADRRLNPEVAETLREMALLATKRSS